MEIQSAFKSGVQGLHKATEEATQAAVNIVANTVVSDEETNLETSSSGVLSTGSSSVSEKTLPDLNQSIVDLKVAEYQAKASTQVIKSADENLGTLLDVTA